MPYPYISGKTFNKLSGFVKAFLVFVTIVILFFLLRLAAEYSGLPLWVFRLISVWAWYLILCGCGIYLIFFAKANSTETRDIIINRVLCLIVGGFLLAYGISLVYPLALDTFGLMNRETLVKKYCVITSVSSSRKEIALTTVYVDDEPKSYERAFLFSSRPSKGDSVIIHYLRRSRIILDVEDSWR